LPDAADHTAGDQAAGLRRLFGARAAQVVAFVSGRETGARGALLAQTAAVLADAGHGVVVIDENPAPDNVSGTFGMTSRYDLLDVIRGLRPARQVMLPAAPRVRTVAASRFADELPHLDAVSVDYLNSGLRQIQHDASFVLIDCAARRGGHVSPLALTARHIAIVVAARGPAITHAYALIKRLAREQMRSAFQVVVTDARSGQEAQAIFDNLRNTAREHLGVRLDFLGGARLPLGDQLAVALQSRLPLPPGPAEGGGFRVLEAPPELRRSGSARAPKRLESVV